MSDGGYFLTHHPLRMEIRFTTEEENCVAIRNSAPHPMDTTGYHLALPGPGLKSLSSSLMATSGPVLTNIHVHITC